MEVIFDNVGFVYTDNATFIKPILNNINIQFKKNSINVVTGKSGSGKTTLIELIDALQLPTKGNIKVGNRIIDQRKVKNINNLRNKVGIVFQFPEEQFFSNTVEKEIEFGIKHLNKSVKDIKKHILDALIMVGLDETYLNKSPYLLSSGEKRKIAIASVLAFNPKLLILDEPTIGLDNESVNNIIKILKLLKNRYDKTIIIVSKDTDFIHKIADYVVVLNDGKLVLEGNKYEVFTSNVESYGIKKPKIIEFEQLAREKGIRLLYRDDINDLMKDVYRHVK